jgi:uncharacterized protein YbjT (DUF2867 family)
MTVETTRVLVTGASGYVGGRLVPAFLRRTSGFKTTQKWRCEVGGHVVEVVKVRPRFVGGLRENSYIVTVDDNQVAAAAGI